MESKEALETILAVITAYSMDKLNDEEFQDVWIEIGYHIMQAKHETDEKYKAYGVDLFKIWSKKDV